MDGNAIQVQALVTFLMPFLIQLAKRSQAKALAWIDESKPRVTMLTSLATALLTSSGIAIAHSAHTLTITYPDGTVILRGLVTLLVTFAGQHVFYQSFWKQVLPSASNQPLPPAGVLLPIPVGYGESHTTGAPYVVNAPPFVPAGNGPAK